MSCVVVGHWVVVCGLWCLTCHCHCYFVGVCGGVVIIDSDFLVLLPSAAALCAVDCAIIVVFVGALLSASASCAVDCGAGCTGM